MAAAIRPFRVDLEDPLERVKAAAAGPWDDSNFIAALPRLLHPHSSTIHPPSSPSLSTTIFLFTVSGPFLNPSRNLHGGAAATIFDLCTSLAIAPLSKPDFWLYAGVSRTLNTSYLKPVPEGMTVAVGCEVLSLGKRGAVLGGWIREWDEKGKCPKGELLVVCEHGKASTDHRFKM